MRLPLEDVCSKWPEIDIRGTVYIALSCWLTIAPLQWVASVLTAAVVHEAGHLMALRHYKIKVWRITVMAGGARIETEPMQPNTELVCALAGPLAGGLLMLAGHWFPKLYICALVQTVFNLLPVYPMDGGRAVRAARQIKTVAKAIDSEYNSRNREK